MSVRTAQLIPHGDLAMRVEAVDIVLLVTYTMDLLHMQESASHTTNKTAFLIPDRYLNDNIKTCRRSRGMSSIHRSVGTEIFHHRAYIQIKNNKEGNRLQVIQTVDRSNNNMHLPGSQ